MATNNPNSLNDAAIAAFQSSPSFKNFVSGGTPSNGMATNNPNSLNNAAIAAFQSRPSFQNLVMGGPPVNGNAELNMGNLGGMFGGNGGLGGGMANAPLNTPAAPLDQNFYNSQIYKDFQNNSANMVGTMDVYDSPYFGQQGSGSVGQEQDRAYEKYLASIGKPVANQNNFTPDMFNMLNGGNSSGNMFGGAPSSGMSTGLAGDQGGFSPQQEYVKYSNPTAGVSNPNNFNFTPTPIDSSGSYDTSDYLSLLGGAYTGGVAGAAAGAGVNEAVGRLQALGQAGVTDYANLARTATQGIDFKPYTLTSALGTTQQTAPGVISQQLTPQQQANVNAAQQQQASLYGAAVPDTSGISQKAFTGTQSQLGQVGANQEDLASLRAGYGTAAQGMTGMLGGSTTGMADQLFQQQQAMRSPVQQRQQLELENRLRAQGRLGTSTAAYGGTPEQLAMAKAVQEQQSADAFNSMSQAEQMATSQQARALGLGNATSDLAQIQQKLTTGDIANAQGLFNIGSSAAQLPQKMQGENIAQAGKLQEQALAPATQQANQLTASANLAAKQADTAATAGRLFSDVTGAGLQERLTAESAAAATRTKQFDSILKSYADQGGATGEAANIVKQVVDAGITKVGGLLYDAAGKLLGPAASVIGKAATDMWDSLTGGGDISMGGDAGLGGPNSDTAGIIADIGNSIGDVVEGGIDAVKKAYDSVFGD